MIHNGIEYGMMQAYAEGFSILQHKTEFNLDLHQIAEIWRYGSVVRSWLLDLTADALEEESDAQGHRSLRVAIRARDAGPRPRRSSSACRRS
jgi:6-phosphogluconate dehydrogenase